MHTSASLPVLKELRERIQRLEGGAARPRTVLPFGIKAIDQHLPEGGLALGALHEVAGGGNGAIDGAARHCLPRELLRAREVKSCGVSRGRISSRPPSPKLVSCPIVSSTWKRVTSHRCSPALRRDCGIADSARSSRKWQGSR
jgi:hypothetical protein